PCSSVCAATGWWASSWRSRIIWAVVYGIPYLLFATAWWHYVLLPVQWVMGPLHGAIVNWCGHKYGYRNVRTGDRSRNTLPLDFVTMGELFQNNHHSASGRLNFAQRSS